MLRKLVGLSLVAAITGCGGGGGGDVVAAETIAVQPPGAVSLSASSINRLDCLTPAIISAVRADPATETQAAFDACISELSSETVALQLTDVEARLTFASILAHAMAPYGGSTSMSLADLLADNELDCDNYARLLGHLASFLTPDAANLHFAGFDHGAVGNHVQVFLGNERLLLDPTIGLVARVSYDALLAGAPVDASQVFIFRQHNDGRLVFFEAMVWDAIVNGSYAPSDVIYYYSSPGDYL